MLLIVVRVHDSVKLETNWKQIGNNWKQIGNICVNLCKFCEIDFGVIVWEEMVANDWDISVIITSQNLHKFTHLFPMYSQTIFTNVETPFWALFDKLES